MLHTKEHVLVLFLFILWARLYVLLLFPLVSVKNTLFWIFKIRGLDSQRIENGLILPGLQVAMTQQLGFPDGLDDDFEPDVLLGGQIILNLVSVFGTGDVILHTVIEAEFFVLFEDIQWELVDFELLVLLELEDLFLKFFDAGVLLILGFK